MLERAIDLIGARRSTGSGIAELRDLLRVDHTIYTSASSSVDPSVRPLVRTTYPADWLQRYLAMSYESVDPILDRGYRSALPFGWWELAGMSSGAASMMSDAARHGIGPNGFTIPLVGKVGRRGLFSVTWSGAAAQWQRFCADNVAPLTQIAHRFHKLASASTAGEPDLHLSAREIECLAWCAQGKDAGDMAVILGLSVYTVREYLKSARYKLDCSNLPQAVAKAIARGLISAD